MDRVHLSRIGALNVAVLSVGALALLVSPAIVGVERVGNSVCLK